MDETDTYKSADLQICAYFLLKELPIVKCSRNGRRVYFHFQDPERCKELVEEYFSGQALVSARDYSQATKQIKDMCFAEIGK